MVAQWLEHLPLVLEVRGLIPAQGKEKFQCLNTLSRVSLDQDVNWMSPVQGKSPPVQVKEPYSDLDMVTCWFLPATSRV